MSKPIRLYSESTERGIFWPGVYFHGLLEHQMGHDLVRSSVELSRVICGRHDCIALVDGMPVPVKLVIWCHDPGEGLTGRKKGIVVRADVADDLEYMEKHYAAKKSNLVGLANRI